VGIKDNIFYILDKGLSFESKEDFVKKVCTILESGKSEVKTADEDCPMGMHGIGSISVSAFSNKWKYTIITPNKKKFTCHLEEVEGRGLTYEISEYEDTEEEKSVLFEVSLSGKQLQYFFIALRDKLAYFKDIYFKFDDKFISANPKALVINSEFKIFKGDDFEMSTLSSRGEMHIVIDQYSYPIRWDVIGLRPIYAPVGLKFSMADGLQPDITRENLYLTPEYTQIIRKKIDKVAKWMIERYNSQNEKHSDSIKYVIDQRRAGFFLELVEGKRLDITQITAICHSPTLKPIVLKGVDDDVMNTFLKYYNILFSAKFRLNSAGNKVALRYGEKSYLNIDHHRGGVIVVNNGVIPPKEMNYIRDTFKGFLAVSRSEIPLKGADVSYTNMLSLCNKEKMRHIYQLTGENVWRQKIEQLNLCLEAYIKEFLVDINTQIIPDVPRKQRVVRRKDKIDLESLQGEIGIKYAENTLISAEFHCKFVEKIVEVKELRKLPFLHIYGDLTDRQKLDQLFLFTEYKSRLKTHIKPCVIAKTNHKILQKLNLPNFMTVEEFYKGKHPLFRKLVTARKISTDIIEEYHHIFRNKHIIYDYISTIFADRMTALEEYVDNFSKVGMNNVCSEVAEELYKIADEGKLYDYSIYEEYELMKEEIKKFDFVDIFTNDVGSYNDSKKERAILIMRDIAKQRKIKMNLDAYNKKSYEK
jgi:hypothetical protein